MNEFKRFEDRLTGLIESLSPSGRRRLAVDIAKKLRQRQQQRIKLQKARMVRRMYREKSQPVRNKKGRIKGKCLKLRTNRFMKATGSESAAVVEFASGVQRIGASIHQLGLKDAGA